MRNLSPGLVDLLSALIQSYHGETPVHVQHELDEIEEMIARKDMAHLMEMYGETLGKIDDRNVYIRHRIREEILRKLIGIHGPEMSEEQEADLLHLLEKMNEHSELSGNKPEVPHFMTLTILALGYRVLPSE
jgi:hypothetical protein